MEFGSELNISITAVVASAGQLFIRPYFKPKLQTGVMNNVKTTIVNKNDCLPQCQNIDARVAAYIQHTMCEIHVHKWRKK